MASREQAYAAATAAYLAGRRLDMRELAMELGVSRNTLYRWTGDRERLLQDVVWALSESAIDEIWSATARRRGTSRLVEALRLLTSHGPFQDRLVAKVRSLVDEEVARGTFVARADTGLLAYAAVRTMEGFVYNDTVVQSEPEVDRAVQVIRLLLE